MKGCGACSMGFAIIPEWSRRSPPTTTSSDAEASPTPWKALLGRETTDSAGTVTDNYRYTYDGSGNRLSQTVNGQTTTPLEIR